MENAFNSKTFEYTYISSGLLGADRCFLEWLLRGYLFDLIMGEKEWFPELGKQT